MKRLFLVLIAFLFLCSIANAFMPIPKPVAYKATITGLQISAVDGNAFIDGANASVTALADGNHTITIYDSAGRFIRGVLKAVGTSETLASDVLSGFDFTSGWTPTRATVLDLNSFISTGTEGQSALLAKSGNIATVLCLYKSALVATATAGTVNLENGGGGTWTANNTTGYRTATTGQMGAVVFNYSAGNGSTTDITTMTVQQVTAPSSSGATIVSTLGGATYNFSYKNTSFTYNQASYFVVIR